VRPRVGTGGPPRLACAHLRDQACHPGRLPALVFVEQVFYYCGMLGSGAGGAPDQPMTAVHLQLGDQSERLLSASGTAEMMGAAKSLRLAALSVQRLLMNPLFAEASPQLDRAISDSERRREELAVLSVEVVNAADYLLRLLMAAPASTPRLILASTGAAECSYAAACDQLTRQRLDARGAAVCAGMRLLARLHSDVAAG
jgi:hypothetical protein